jgi:hypothetical protein
VAGATVTVATGTAVTVIVAVPVLPSLVAVIVAVPVPTAVTTPVCATVATLALLVDQAMGRPVSTVPFPSRVSAESVVVWPTVRLAVGGVTVTVATGAGVTVTVAVPLLPSLDAVIVTVPGLSAFTPPVLDTTAMASSLDVHPTIRLSSAPDASRTLAESCVDAPTTTLTVGGVTTTLATGT